MISSRHLRYRYQIFQNFKPVAIVAVPVDEREKLGGGSEQISPSSSSPTNDLALSIHTTVEGTIKRLDRLNSRCPHYPKHLWYAHMPGVLDSAYTFVASIDSAT
jgi:hypothetical protein